MSAMSILAMKSVSGGGGGTGGSTVVANTEKIEGATKAKSLKINGVDWNLPDDGSKVTAKTEKIEGAGELKAVEIDGEKFNIPDNTETTEQKFEDVQTQIDNITNVIDNTASQTNKILPESKVDSKIANIEARVLYKDNTQGSFQTHAELVSATKFYNAAGNEVTVNTNDTTFILKDETRENKTTKYTVQSVNPVVWAFVIEFTDTVIKLNGSEKQGETAEFYAPETSGETGKILTSGGENASPVWAEIATDGLVYYEHNITAYDTDLNFINFSFINTTKNPYSTAQYGSSTEANKAISKALYSNGFNSPTNSLNGNVYGLLDAKIKRFNGTAWVDVTFANFVDNITRCGGTKEYFGGNNISISGDNVITNTQHIKPYQTVLKAGETSATVVLDSGYMPISFLTKLHTGEVVQLDQSYDETNRTVTLTINESIDYDIFVQITAVTNTDIAPIVSCPFPIGFVLTMNNATDPSTIWVGTSWERLADGQFVMNTTDNDAVGTIQQEELPNIKGSFNAGYNGGSWTGCIKNEGNGTGAFQGVITTSYAFARATINANKYCETYKDDGKVRPFSMKCAMWTRIS